MVRWGSDGVVVGSGGEVVEGWWMIELTTQSLEDRLFALIKPSRNKPLLSSVVSLLP